MTITELMIPHHGRSVHAVMYLPDSAAPVPAVLMSHGYNGCKTDFDSGISGHSVCQFQIIHHKQFFRTETITRHNVQQRICAGLALMLRVVPAVDGIGENIKMRTVIPAYIIRVGMGYNT